MSHATQIDFSTISAHQRYKLMASLIVPRPIALVTTQNAQGVVNAAPFSMFNMLGEDPPILMISINKLQDELLKDTSANILANGEFVVHIADEPMAEQMHRCGDRLPSSHSELDAVGLTAVASRAVLPPRIEQAPVAFECRVSEKIETASRHIFIGEVLWLHAREDLIDLERYRVKLQNYFPVGRFGASFYIRTRERFSMQSASEVNTIDTLD
ncbi:MAG: flavin reductase family protein [Proteobacteria bacterium]|nr:flavin reductase family protein [Pseudomonadota bacterium]